MNGKQLQSALSTGLLMIIISGGVGTAAYAAPTGGDYFGRTTGTTVVPGSKPAAAMPSSLTPANKPLYHYGEKPAQKWFATFDEEVDTHKANPGEKMMLSRQFGNPPQLERVIEWTNTAAGVAKKYRNLAKILRSMPVPQSMVQDTSAPISVTFYRQALADWYDDSASVLEEYIKPRPAARTQEELTDQLNRVHEHAQGVKLTFTHLAEMDSSLRQHFDVSIARSEDKLMQWVSKRPE